MSLSAAEEARMTTTPPSEFIWLVRRFNDATFLDHEDLDAAINAITQELPSSERQSAAKFIDTIVNTNFSREEIERIWKLADPEVLFGDFDQLLLFLRKLRDSLVEGQLLSRS